MDPVSPVDGGRAAQGADAGAAVGIDLGTSNTVVAHVDAGLAQALTDRASDQLVIPSVCAFHPSGVVLVGQEAKDRRLQDPKNTVFSTKRLLGRPWSSKEIAQARVRLPYELREGKNSSVLVVARNKEYTLPEISAFVLRKAKAIAEASVGKSVDRAVITCPANFDDLQRGATKLAGKLAGLEVLRVLNEPTAAALAYGYGKEGQERILVYDFGGGTFDVTLLERRGAIFRVRSTAGDSYLGGDDIDGAVANRIAEGFAEKHFYDPRADKQVFEHVREAAEKLKVKLSKDEQASIELVDVAFGVGGKSLTFEFSMKRSELAPLADPFIEKTFKVCKKALANAGVEMKDIDQVLLVGGSTLIGRVRERVTEFFEREPASGVSPFEAVAIGAAIQASAMTEASTEEDDVPTLDALVMLKNIVTVPPPSLPVSLPISIARIPFPLGGLGASIANDPVASRAAKTDPPKALAGKRVQSVLAKRGLQLAGWLVAGALGLALLGIVWLLIR
jgi:molecular chaperone DnaK